MNQLSLALLGPVQIALDREPVAGFDYAKVRALLVFLAVERERPHQRDTVAELLWPEQEPQVARNSLRQALSKLRQTIRDSAADPPFLLITRETLQLNPRGAVWLDVAAFEALLAEAEQRAREGADAAELAVLWEQAAALYRGPFLDQAVPRDSVAFEEWALVRREQFEAQARALLARLADHYEARDEHVLALRAARRHLELDPWNEPAHRQVMRLLARAGQRSAALAQYAHCRRVLAEDLGVAPEDETTALYEQIRTSSGELRVQSEELRVTKELRVQNEELRVTDSSQLSTLNSQFLTLNFPVQATPFVGRESELVELGDLLAEPACRLVTLLGPGGIGKTRLALRAAEVYGVMFAHGACWAPLAALAGPEQLVGALARALAVPIDETGDPQHQLLDALAGKEMLLVCDNFEHVLEGSDLLVDLLAHAPRLKLLVTSRERLHLQWEWLLDVRGLPYPRRAGPEDIAGYSAVRLLLGRAQRLRRIGELTTEDQGAIVRICHLVEGMPLALELAATANREQSFAEIAGAVAANLDLLQATFRDQPERHRSVRAAFAYSWRMLSDREQQICARLAVFRGSIAAAAAAEIAGAPAEMLESFADRSLLRRAEDGRYTMHELIRQFAAEQLAAAGMQDQTFAAHLGYFVALAERAEPLLRGPEQQHWLDELEREHDNIRAALTWSLSDTVTRGQGDKVTESEAAITVSPLYPVTLSEIGLRLAGALWRFWWIRGYAREGRQWLEQAVGEQGLDGGALSAPVRARALNGLGALVEEHGDFAEAATHYAASLELYRALDDRAGLMSALNNLGGVYYKQGSFERAEACFVESAGLARSQGDRYGTAVALHNLAGVIYDSGGDLARGRALLEECLVLWEAIRMAHGTATTLSSLGQLALIQQDNAGAAGYFAQSLVVLRGLGDIRSISLSLTGLGRASCRMGDQTAALAAYREALALRHELGDKLGVAECCEGLGEVALAQGVPERAARLYAAAEAIREQIGSPVMPVDRPAYELALAGMRTQLDPRRFTDLWAEGRALTIDAAVAYAIEGVGAL